MVAIFSRQPQRPVWHAVEQVQALEPRTLLTAASPTNFKINFQPASSPAFADYLTDSGGTYTTHADSGLAYGWTADRTADMRARNSPASFDQRYDTFAYMQKGGVNYNWDVKVPAGRYFVYLVGGDPTSSGTPMNITVEGATGLQGTPTAANPFLENGVYVTVTADASTPGYGKLTLQNVSTTGTDDKINSIRVVQVPLSLDPMDKEARQSVDDLQTNLHDGKVVDVRDLTRTAYAALAINYPGTGANAASSAAALAGDYIDRALATMNAVGDFPWKTDKADYTDLNSGQFVMNFIALIYKEYGGRLGKAYWQDGARAALISKAIGNNVTGGIKNYAVEQRVTGIASSYTNIYTMKFANEILLGEMTGDSGLRQAGYAGLNTWIGETKTLGQPSEYDSPTYATVTLNNLLGLYNNTTNAKVHDRVKAMLDYLSYDLSANYFAGQGGALSGPHSRDYNFIDSTGPIDHFYEIEGLASDPISPTSDSEGMGTYLNLLEAGYHPDPTITAVGHTDVRVVKTTWGDVNGPSDGQDRYNYITPNYAIGSSSAYFGKQDKQIVGSFASPANRRVADITVIDDEFDAPYGMITQGTLHPKPTHLENASATVQDKNVLLSLSDLRPQFKHNASDRYTSIASNVVFPGNADKVYLVHKTGTNTVQVTDLKATGQWYAQCPAIDFAVGDVLGVRQGNTVFAIRPALVDGVGGQSGKIQLTFDGDTIGTKKPHVGRLVAYHYVDKADPAIAVPDATNCRFALAMAAESFPAATADADIDAYIGDMAKAKFDITPTYSGATLTRWRAEFELRGNNLRASQKTDSDTIDYRQYTSSTNVKGTVFPPARFTLTTQSGTQAALTSDLAMQILDPIDTSPIP